jgi:hypothetical protein
MVRRQRAMVNNAQPSLRGAKRRSNPYFLFAETVDCFAEACHRARIRATRWLAMTIRKKAGIAPGLLFPFPDAAQRETVRC